MEAKHIIRALEDRGYSLARIARELEPPVTRQTVSRALRNPADCARAREAIIHALGFDPWAEASDAAA